MKKTIVFMASLLAYINMSMANDGVYFTSGNFLVPIQETDIAAAKEILTITIGKDSFATVDVLYELQNNGKAKTVKMAFEAEPQYNTGEPLHRNGIHPFISDFTVSMNGRALSHSNGIVALPGNDINRCNFAPLDMSKWKAYGEVPDSVLPAETILYNAELDSIVPYAYAYYFDAPFRKGLNIVHHTYRYRMSYNIAETFSIPYWLTPVTRWANRQVDDFTLRIKADDTTELCLYDSLFHAAPFTSAKGREIYHLKSMYGDSFIFATLTADDSITWHCHDFRPTANMSIGSPSWSEGNIVSKYRTEDYVVTDSEGNTSRYLADCGDSYFVLVQDYGLVKKAGSRLKEYKAESGQGFIVINDNAAKRVNVRQRPTVKSSVVGALSHREGELPDVLPCLGLTGLTADGYRWYKTKLNGRTGYIRQDLMLWDAINTY